MNENECVIVMSTQKLLEILEVFSGVSDRLSVLKSVDEDGNIVGIAFCVEDSDGQTSFNGTITLSIDDIEDINGEIGGQILINDTTIKMLRYAVSDYSARSNHAISTIRLTEQNSYKEDGCIHYTSYIETDNTYIDVSIEE